MMLDKTFSPLAFESEQYRYWQSLNAFAPQGEGQPYCIMLPPPNVTGILHMGHAFQQTLMDILIRYHRMRGNRTLWQAGTDHAGIATQMVVERQLLQAGIRKETLGREAFLEKVWEWKAESGNAIVEQMKTMGASADWSRSRFTLDEGMSEAVQAVFIQLYEEGLIYRGQRLVNWDPVLQTAVSDLEVDLEEVQGSLWYIRYPAVDGGPGLVVATTRPETLLGDVAVAVHPENTKHKHLIGQFLTLPLCNRQIPVVADDSVDPEFGTGCVKITPAHDFNDYALGVRHNLPRINILTKDGHINDQAPKVYQGLDRFEARKQVVKDLESVGLLEKIEPHTLSIPRGDRTGVILEPYLTDQWFVNTKPLAEPAIKAVESGQIKFVPENWSKTYFEWMNNIEDWCISRQLWWGHRIPAWYDETGKIYVGKDETAVRAKHGLAASVVLTQDNDVLDTWFSSALWPFSTLGWPKQTPDLAQFYPGQVLITGFDIIFFWVARMVMFGLKFTGTIPFQTVYIHGLIQDAYGQKMSKSKGNILDPMDLIFGVELDTLVKKRLTGLMQPQLAQKIEKDTRKEFPDGIPAYGTDALRFTFAALATSNRFIRFDLNRIEGYRNFCNKLWNATRYVLMNTAINSDGTERGEFYTVKPKQLTTIDEWILSRWQTAKADVHRHLEQYRFDLAAQALYEFTWNEYCDWYLELSKPVLTSVPNAEHASAAYGTRHTLLSILEELLRVMHPFMPFITEHIWQQVAPHCVANFASRPQQTISLQAYPVVDDTQRVVTAESQIEFLKKIILEIRNIRGEMNVSPKAQIPLLLRGPESYRARIAAIAVWLSSIAKIRSCDWLVSGQTIPPAATGIVDDLELFIPMAGLIDHTQEIARLKKEIEKNQKEAANAEQKLANPNYVKKAPPAVVAQEQDRLAMLQLAVGKLTQRLAQLQEIVRE